MKTALRRELEAAGWRAVGVAIGFALLLGGTFLWGLSIEGQLDDVVEQHREDRRVLYGFVHDARAVEVQGNSKEVQDLEFGETDGRTDAGAQPAAPSVPDQFPGDGNSGGVDPAKPGKQRQPKGGQGGGGAAAIVPVPAPSAQQSGPVDPNPDKGNGAPTEMPEPKPIREALGGALEDVGSVVSGTACGLARALDPDCP